jgi:large subunit ribosomal protein L1
MSKKQKASPSQLAMSEVLEREYKQDDVEVKTVEKKDVDKTVENKPKQQARKRGKKYVDSLTKVAVTAPLSPEEAVKLIQEVIYTKFEETLELHVNVIENNIKGEVKLPFSTGKKVSVVAADEALIEKLEKGIVDFDILVTTPTFMPKLTKFAKLLGPKGLMPNPKAGTIGVNTDDLIKKFSGNTVRFKTESKSPIIHVTIGKTKSTVSDLVANIDAYLNAIGRKNIKDAYLASSMSPSVKIATQ